jgi:hypothetical protein
MQVPGIVVELRGLEPLTHDLIDDPVAQMPIGDAAKALHTKVRGEWDACPAGVEDSILGRGVPPGRSIRLPGLFRRRGGRDRSPPAGAFG